MTEVSATRLYLGNLPKGVTKQDVESHFATHGTGEITEIKLMNGFGFIEYKDAMDARDVVPAFHGSDFMGERLTVQFARGSRHREPGFGNHERTAPRPRRTAYRMQITGLPNDTSWQDLKDFARQSSLDVVYSETGREGNGRGFVEFENAGDLRTAVEKLDNREFKGQRVTCVADGGRSRLRSLAVTAADRDLREDAALPDRPVTIIDVALPVVVMETADTALDGMITVTATVIVALVAAANTMMSGGTAAHPRVVAPPMDDYPPPRGRYEDPYRRDYGPPPDPYVNGRAPYDRPPRDFPPRDGPYPPREGAYPRDDYRRGGAGGGYW
ncbi:hypothetical protein PG996_013181 [Apiospora saccharicola]|uniref:RRM domain-containing protein n=1 Tax=Apiospora saccharicola TaxID=335842 RepID=A0ABR1U4R6_9PEZI